VIKQRYDFGEVREIYQENKKQLDNLVKNIVQLSCETRQTIATAESCTGGLLSQCITAVSGASQMFALGICTYTNAMKEAILHVPHETLEDYTAVSSQTAIAMAEGVAALSHADLALSTTGYAGPGGGTAQAPVGTVFLGVAFHGTAFSVHLPMADLGAETREAVRYGAAVCAFGIAKEILMEDALWRKQNIRKKK
jgi:nicotinamide-nucleotide amidase